MSYECSYCNSELEHHDTWGVGVYWMRENKPEGEIFKCPNAEGFEDEETAIEYLKQEGGYDEMFIKHCSWEDIVCESNCHHVSGSFYTDRSGDLKEGYPC